MMIAALLLGSSLASAPAGATEVGTARPIGVGFAIGSPISIVGKYFLSDSNALDAGLAFWRWGRNCNRGPGPDPCDDWGYLGIAGDYLWHQTLAQGTAKLDWHFGPGGRLWIGDRDYYGDGSNVALAGRFPIGIDLTFEKPEFLEVFVELAPLLYVIPGLDFDVEGFIGVRFYF
jgi:hypothetical protein